MDYLRSIIESGHYADYSLAFVDEIEIERRVMEGGRRAGADDLARLEYEELKKLLRRIDELKICGEYEAFRRELRENESVRNGPLSKLAEGWSLVAKWFSHADVRNVMDGRRSPDPAQRERFQTLIDDHLGDKTPREVQTLISCLERAKRPKGAPRLRTPWANVIEDMDAMRLAVAGGASRIEAARERADMRRAGGEERAKTLSRLYRQKMALRE